MSSSQLQSKLLLLLLPRLALNAFNQIIKKFSQKGKRKNFGLSAQESGWKGSRGRRGGGEVRAAWQQQTNKVAKSSSSAAAQSDCETANRQTKLKPGKERERGGGGGGGIEGEEGRQRSTLEKATKNTHWQHVA